MFDNLKLSLSLFLLGYLISLSSLQPLPLGGFQSLIEASDMSLNIRPSELLLYDGLDAHAYVVGHSLYFVGKQVYLRIWGVEVICAPFLDRFQTCDCALHAVNGMIYAETFIENGDWIYRSGLLIHALHLVDTIVWTRASAFWLLTLGAYEDRKTVHRVLTALIVRPSE